MGLRTGAFIALAAVLAAGSASAHHNMSALFDFNDRVTLTGTLTQIDWRNPHIALIVDAKMEGNQVQTWSIEGPPPGFFRARDINKADVEAALLQCRTGAPNELARKLNARIDCSLKKLSASKLAVVLSVAYQKDGKLMVIRIDQEVSWDDLPGEIRSRFITENPAELCYVIVEQQGKARTEQSASKEI